MSYLKIAIGVLEAMIVRPLGELVAMLIGFFHRPIWIRWRRWKYRSHASDTRDAIAALEDRPNRYGGLVDMEHPGDAEQKIEALEAEAEYYELRAEILE